MTYVFMLLSIFFWASSFVGIRATLHEYNPTELAVFRLMVASVLFFIIAFVRKIRIPAKKDLILVFLIGFLLFINSIVLNYWALNITASEISFILNSSPLFTFLLAYLFLKESISSRFVIGLSICFIGVSLISLNFSTGFSFKPGILFILLASITYSTFFILQKPLLKRYCPLEVSSYAIWIATVLMLPFGISVFKTILSVNIYSAVAAIYIGIFPTVIAFLCWSAVLSKIKIPKASTFLYLIPVITIIIGYIWLHELPPLKSFFGGIIAIIGVIIANRKSTNTEPPHALDSQSWRPDLK